VTPAGGGRRVLVLGGSRSGKSRFAEDYLGHDENVTYVATAAGNPGDADWAARIERHRRRRPDAWATVETADPAELLVSDDAGPLLIDSVTTWLTRVMDACGCWLEIGSAEQAELPGLAQAATTAESAGADERLAAALDRLVHAWAHTTARAVAVSDEVGSGIVPETASGRHFRDELGELNQRLAAASDEVWLLTAGIPLRLR